MKLQTLKSKQPKILIAILAFAALAVAALAVTMTGGAQAQSSDNTYADPQPCDALTASMPEPHEVTTGHFILFDAYWENTTDEQSVDGNTGVLHTNLCPPQLTTTTQTDRDGNETVVASLTESGLDVRKAIIHVLDTHKATVVATNAEVTGGQLSLEEYPELRRGLGLGENDPVPAGTQVWWLRLDDPDTGTESSPVDETSDLTLGFSTKRFDSDYWDATSAGDGNPPMRYKFEIERNPGIAPKDHPHFLAYRAPLANNRSSAVVWDSTRADTDDMMMAPGQLEDLQWIFTQQGTYEISVHLQGWVRESRPEGASRDWMRISGNVTETGEVQRYVIQVGTPLAEVEPPKFGVTRSVPENSTAGTAVGDPIQLFGAEVDSISYTLSGDGADQFAIGDTSDRNAAQIVVAENADLDFETKNAYDLVLSVTDNIDHESNPDDTTDHTLAVRIDLEGEAPSVTLSIAGTSPQRDRYRLATAAREAPPGSTPVLTWYQKNDNDVDWTVAHLPGETEPFRGEAITVHNGPNVDSVTFKVKMDWGTGNVWSNELTIQWRQAQ